MSAPMNLEKGRPVALVLLFLFGLILAVGLGAGSNAVNGQVSPQYFVTNLGWDDIEDVPRAAIAHGILEGLLIGLAFATIYAVVVAVVSRGCSPLSTSAGILLAVALGGVLCWAIGGGVAIGLASLSPEFYRETFRGVPEVHEAMLRYAWVGGSILGLEIGGFACLVLGCAVFHGKWKRMLEL